MNQANLIQTLAPVLFTVEMAIYAILGGLGITGLVLFVWRWNVLGRAQGDPAKWRTILSADLAKGSNLDHVQVSIEEERTLPGRVVKLGKDSAGLSPEALEKVFDVQESTERRHLEAGVSFLGTVGANAPFLGLTGTVLGILIAFNKFAQSGGKGGTDVMVAIARALVATALGLIVAIPAVVAFNIIKNRIRNVLDILIAFNKFAQSGGKGGTDVMVAIARALVATALGLIVAIPAVVAYNILRGRVKAIQDRSREVRGLIVARSLHAASKES